MFLKKINLILTAASLLVLTEAVDKSYYYCRLESCSNPERHILCLHPRQTVHERCSQLIRSALTSKEKAALLNAHIEVRKKYAAKKRVKFPDILWNHDLEEMAQRWADQCTTENDECRSIDEYSYVVKQNVAHYSMKDKFPHLNHTIQFDIKKAVNDWATIPFNPANPSVKTFRAMDRVGCGLTVSSSCNWKTQPLTGGGICLHFYHFYFVCNYAISRMRLKV